MKLSAAQVREESRGAGPLAALGALLHFGAPLLAALALPALLPDGGMAAILIVCAMAALLLLSGAACGAVAQAAARRAGQYGGTLRLSLLFEAMLAQPAAFFRARAPAALAQELLALGEELQDAATHHLRLWCHGAALAGALAVIALLALPLLPWALAAQALLLPAWLALPALQRRRQMAQAADAVQAARLAGYAAGLDDLHALAAQDGAYAAWLRDARAALRAAQAEQSLHAHVRLGLRAAVLAGLLLFAWLLPATHALALLLAQAWALAAHGKIFAACTAASAWRQQPLWRELAEVAPAPAGVRVAWGGRGELSLQRVHFRYGTEAPPVLRDCSLTLEAGACIGLAGPSGSGKSTLLRLLLGLERPQAGAIYLDGVDIAGLDAAALRAGMGALLQDERIEAGDILGVLAGGARLAPSQAWRALAQAALDEEVRALPMGLATPLTEGAPQLSAAQRQRLLLARVLVREPRVLLLDEAFASLDDALLARVMNNLARLDLTCLCVSHRPALLRLCERVEWLEKKHD